MKELILTLHEDKITGEINNVEIPKPKDDEVLIKISVSGVNPKDWKYLENQPFNSGDDMVGIVEAVGENVVEFKKGDRVASFHVMGDKHGSFAEYGIAPAQTTFHVPKNISDEEAATVPLTVLTAGVGIHGHLGLPTPWHPAQEKDQNPLVVYGGSSANGLYALKLARLSGLSPLITIAGGGADIIEEGHYADVIIDYRKEKDIPGAIRHALPVGVDLRHAYDAITEHGSTKTIAEAMTNGGSITGILACQDNLPNGVVFSNTYVGSVHHRYEKSSAPRTQEQVDRDREYAYVLTKYLTRVLGNGSLKPHPYEVVEGGLNGLAKRLQDLREGKVRAKKLVVKIADTQ